MTDEESKQLDNLEQNLKNIHGVLQGQIAEAKKQFDALTAESYRTEGALRLIQTLRLAVTPTTPPPVLSPGLMRQKERKNETLPLHTGSGLSSVG